ncbi:uncharacterized protein A4U43_UnF9050 [Asparagus officinalis]|uniref:Uncharacterized protein n=1 Tax=Asparagus officinalis TaxID=4686 RepID=A0A1R3L5U4_ASPOF|nr:uncharacterized protein A4U43_UnF9050 [Asparagus officinalis]
MAGGQDSRESGGEEREKPRPSAKVRSIIAPLAYSFVSNTTHILLTPQDQKEEPKAFISHSVALPYHMIWSHDTRSYSGRWRLVVRSSIPERDRSARRGDRPDVEVGPSDQSPSAISRRVRHSASFRDAVKHTNSFLPSPFFSD